MLDRLKYHHGISRDPSTPCGQTRSTGTAVLRVENGLITRELGLDDGVTALKQLDLIPNA